MIVRDKKSGKFKKVSDCVLTKNIAIYLKGLGWQARLMFFLSPNAATSDFAQDLTKVVLRKNI